MQERQFPPFDSENLTPAERRTLRRARTRRSQAFALGVAASVLALFAVGCPGPADLANPQDYPVTAGPPTGGSAAAGTSAGGTSAGPTCETDCVNAIFQKDMQPCLLCHSTATKLGDLDLQSPNYTMRLKDQPAKHTGFTGPTTDCPTGDKLIDTANPANSWFLKKLHNEQKTCGTVMPQAGTLTAAQKTCIETYVACVAPGGAAPAGGTSSGGTASGGTASAGTASGGASAGTASGGSGGAKGGSGGTGGT